MQLMMTNVNPGSAFVQFLIFLYFFAGYHLEQLFLGILFEKTGALGSSQVF